MTPDQIQRLRDERLGCLDSGCVFAPLRDNSGQHTNAGCRCLKELPPKLRRDLRALVDEVRERRAADPAPIDWASLPRECRVCSGKIGLDEAAVYGRRGPVHQACEALL